LNFVQNETEGMRMGRDRCLIERWGTGFSLIEVLVAAAVFSLGLAGLSLMLLTSVHGTAEARNRTAAIMHASALAELILLNPASLGHYMAPPAATSDCLAPEGCSAAEWGAGNLARWHYDLQQSLAEAEGLVCRDSTPEDGDAGAPACDGTGGAVVKVFWNEAGDAPGNDPVSHRVAVAVLE
jgi:type IV pilus assembly protein PilV